MSVAIFSCVHGNLHAMEAVLQHARKQGVTTFYNLGDLVGYGPRAAETAALARELCEINLMGDHEELVTKQNLDGFGMSARNVAQHSINEIERHDLRLKRSFLSKLMSATHRQKGKPLMPWLAGLPQRVQTSLGLLVHGSPRGPLDEYVLIEHVFGHNYNGDDAHSMIMEWSNLFGRRCFVGHSHRPGVLEYTKKRYRWLYPDNSNIAEGFNRSSRVLKLKDSIYESNKQAIINVGSVGQPRDDDPRACYVTVTKGVVQWHKVEYDVEATRADIDNCTLIADIFGERLSLGK